MYTKRPFRITNQLGRSLRFPRDWNCGDFDWWKAKGYSAQRAAAESSRMYGCTRSRSATTESTYIVVNVLAEDQVRVMRVVICAALHRTDADMG